MAAPKTTKTAIKKQNKKKKKDPHAPKRALSAYMFFVKDKRLEIIKDHPELTKDIAKVGKMIGDAWSKLSEAQKLPYQKKADQDKDRYAKEKEEYLKKNKA